MRKKLHTQNYTYKMIAAIKAHHDWFSLTVKVEFLKLPFKKMLGKSRKMYTQGI